MFGVASPLKFGDVVEKAGIDWDGRGFLSELEAKTKRYTDWEANEDWYLNLRELVTRISESKN